MTRICTCRPNIFAIVFCCCAAFTAAGFAVDDPDAPDLVAEFNARAQKFETRISRQADSTAEVSAAYAEYEKFLDQELNTAYKAMLSRLTGDLKDRLVKSQKHWLTYRDSEYEFIENNWTSDRSGTSYVYSCGAARAAVVKDRIIELLRYTNDTAKKDPAPANPKP